MNEERNAKLLKFLAKHGDSTLFTIKILSPFSDRDIQMLVTGLKAHLAMETMFSPLASLDHNILCISEQLSDTMAKEMNEYRGTYINIIIAGNFMDYGEEILNILRVGLETTNILCEMIGFKEVKNNV